MRPKAPPQLIHSAHTRVGETDVHVLDVRLVSFDCDDLPIFSSEERARAASIPSVPRRRQFLAARAVARAQIGLMLEIDPAQVSLGYGRWGKPEVVDPIGGPRFNVAHSGDLAVVAVARDSGVGIDIERIEADRAWDKLIERICQPVELAEARAEAGRFGVRGFYDRWVAKEAVLKASGRGLSVSPAEVRLRRGVDDALSMSAPAPYSSAIAELSAIPVPGYAVALAVEPSSAGMPQSRIAGNSTTSRIESLPVSSITSRSMPRPTPAVGGIPCSSAWMYASS
jgi:4'-phosphopantetheinyl transferase